MKLCEFASVTLPDSVNLAQYAITGLFVVNLSKRCAGTGVSGQALTETQGQAKHKIEDGLVRSARFRHGNDSWGLHGETQPRELSS